LYDDNLIPNKDYFHDKNDDNLMAGSLAPIPSAEKEKELRKALLHHVDLWRMESRLPFTQANHKVFIA
jgi:hypothetical protein